MAYRDFVSLVHKSTKRDYLARVTQRDKADVAEIRHVYLDFDENGTAAAGAVLNRTDLPTPNFLVNTSKDKWQVVWRVTAFT